MILSTLAFAMASNPQRAKPQPRPVLLSAVMVRHQEPTAKGGVRATVAEVYPIAWNTGDQWDDASVDAKAQADRKSSVRAGDRFQIYKGGWQVGWFDVNRTAPKPYASSSLWVGLGGWSLPRRLYPYRLVRSRNVNYLAYAAYTWGNSKYQNSVQPFLALNVERRSLASTEFSPGQMKRDVWPVIKEQMGSLARGVGRDLTPTDLHLRTLKGYDLDNDRIPEVVAVFDVPSLGSDRTVMLIGTVHASAFIERYRTVNEGVDWEPFDVLDVDGDGYKEMILTGRGFEYFGFQVLQRSHGKLRKVFQGASFGA